MNFAVSADHCVKIKENPKDRQILGLCQKTKTKQNQKISGIWGWLLYQRVWKKKKTGANGNQGKNQYHPRDSMVEIDKNTRKSPEDLGRLAIT